MRLIILSFCVLLAALPVQAQDDFYVDLSALDALEGSFDDAADAELLFPPVAVVENKTKDIKPAPKPEVKPRAEQPKPVAFVASPEKSAAAPVEAEDAQDKTVVSAVAPEQVADAVKEASDKPAMPEEENVTSSEAPAEAAAAAPEPAPEPAPVAVPEAVVAKPEPLPMPAEVKPVVLAEPLIAPEDEEDLTGVFAFGEGLYDVTSVMKLQLDELVKKFENPVANKILIVAYNYNKDGGFMSKHIALKRSTGIRSYLLNKGYKNFSIKIINTDNPQQKNLTEVSEIK